MAHCIILDVASAGHGAEPFACIAFVDMDAGCQLGTCGRPKCQALEEAKPIAKGREDGRRHRARVADGLAEKCLGFVCVKYWLCRHV